MALNVQINIFILENVNLDEVEIVEERKPFSLD